MNGEQAWRSVGLKTELQGVCAAEGKLEPG